MLRIAPIKDVKTLIHAFARLKDQVPEAKLMICGPEDDPEYAAECYQLVERLGVEDIQFLGTVSVLEVLPEFDFTVLSSISEGMPLSVLESFAAGRPCVTTDVGSCRELLDGMDEGDDLGSAGICVPPMDAAALARAMGVMCRYPERRYRMGIAARKRAERYFQHNDMIRSYLKLYDEVFRRWQESASA